MRSSMHVHVGRVLVHDGDILGGALDLEVGLKLLNAGLSKKGSKLQCVRFQDVVCD